MDSQQERIRGAEADQLLRNPLLIEALQTIETNVVKRLAEQNLNDEQVIQLRNLLVGKRAFERYLTQIVTTGRMAELGEQEKARVSWMDRARAVVR